MGMLGIAMIIHFWGNMDLSAIVSDLVGLVLIIFGIVTFIQFIRCRKNVKTD